MDVYHHQILTKLYYFLYLPRKKVLTLRDFSSFKYGLRMPQKISWVILIKSFRVLILLSLQNDLK